MKASIKIKTIKRLSLYSLICWTIFIISCQPKNRSIDIYSYQIENFSKKSEILKKYLKKESGLMEAEYHIWYQDNGTGRVPGPSDYNLKLAMKIIPDSLDAWTNGLEKSSEKITLDHWKELKLDENIWHLESDPELYYSRLKTEIKLVFRKEHIILAIYSTTPVLLN